MNSNVTKKVNILSQKVKMA